MSHCKKLSENIVSNWERSIGDAGAPTLQMRIERLLQAYECEIAEYRQVLEFYGNGGNSNQDVWVHPDLGYFTGKKAREVLKKYE